MSRNRAWALAGLLLLALLSLATLLPGDDGASAQAAPRFSQLDIALWPEYDEPPTWTDPDRPPVLVIIRGELAADTVLPASVSLRIPAAAGQPFAVASSSDPASGLESREYETAAEGDSLRITFETPDPVVHLEFYLPITRAGLLRDFTYVWPGDIAADSVTLRAQIPVGAEDFQTEPPLGSPEIGPDGLSYRQTTLGAQETGQTLSFRVQYSKEDPRLTIETLPEAQPSDDDGGAPLPWPALAAIAAVVVVGIVAVAWYRYYGRRPAPARARPGGAAGAAGYCTQCGQALSAADRFCSRCGTPVRK
jgi:hypothetical protein